MDISPDIDVDLHRLRDALDAKRVHSGYSWSRLARELGVSTSSLTRMADPHTTISTRHLKRFADWLGRDVREFYSDWVPAPLESDEDFAAYARQVQARPSRMPDMRLT
jgi:hypothetical protein